MCGLLEPFGLFYFQIRVLLFYALNADYVNAWNEEEMWMTELQIRKRNKIEKLNCKHETKRTFPVVLCGMFAFDSFLLERKMDAYLNS